MDNDLFEKGLAQRKATLGAEHVEKTWRPPMTLPVLSRKR